MNRLAVFPINNRNNYIAKNKDLIENYDLKYAIYLIGENEWVMKNTLDGISYTSDYNEAVINTDAILILEGLNKKFYTEYIKLINLYISYDRKIIFTKSMYNIFCELINETNNIEIIDKPNCNDEVADDIKEIDIPVICVMSNGEHTGKFETQLVARKVFMEYGYNVLQFGTKPVSQLFGFEALPEFLFQDNISLEKKIYMFNHYIYRKSSMLDIDAIIIGLPGGIMPLNNNCYNHFSEIALVISRAVDIDYCIMHLYQNRYINEEYINKIKIMTLEKYRCIVEYFVFSNTQYRYNEEMGSIEYISFDEDEIEENLPQLYCKGNNYVSLADKMCIRGMIDDIVHKMQSDIDIL